MGYGYSKGVTTGRRVICITPLGYYEDGGLRIMDRITKITSSFKRKETKDLLENPNDYDKLSDDILYALDLGRKAPSAANSQMWRFGFEDDFRTISVAMPVGYNPAVTVNEESGRAVWRLQLHS